MPFIQNDIDRWKLASDSQRKGFCRKTPEQLGSNEELYSLVFYLDVLARISIAEERFEDALMYIQRMNETQFARLDSAARNIEADSTKQMIFEFGINGAPRHVFFDATLIGLDFLDSTCRRFINHELSNEFPSQDLALARFFLNVANDEPIKGISHTSHYIQSLTKAFERKDSAIFIETLIEESNDAMKYAESFTTEIVYDSGTTGFFKLARETWLDDGSVDHPMIPLGLINSKPNRDLDIDLPFNVDSLNWS